MFLGAHSQIYIHIECTPVSALEMYAFGAVRMMLLIPFLGIFKFRIHVRTNIFNPFCGKMSNALLVIHKS